MEDNVQTIITLPVTPLFSKWGTGAFQAEVRRLLEKYESDMTVIDVDDWNTHPELVAVLVDRVQSAYEWLPASIRPNTKVLFTAHSQPINPNVNQVYIKQFTELASAIAKQLDWKNWQVTSNKEKWLGPDVMDVIRLEAEQGMKGIITCELLFVIADIEVFFEIGQKCQELCKKLVLDFVRTEFPNDSFDFILAVAAIVKEKVKSAQVVQ